MSSKLLLCINNSFCYESPLVSVASKVATACSLREIFFAIKKHARIIKSPYIWQKQRYLSLIEMFSKRKRREDEKKGRKKSKNGAALNS